MSENSMWRVAVAIMFVGIVIFIIFVAVRMAVPATWEFSIEAEAQVVQLNLRPDSETQWQIDGATICTSDHLSFPDELRRDATQNPCSRRMQPGWSLSAPEQVLRLSGGASVLLQTMTDGGYAMIVRATDNQPLGWLSLVGVVDDVVLGERIDLHWAADSIVARNFPFSGSTTLGRAIAWSDSRILESGSITVYTSDESADKRTQVDETILMLGDQVSLGAPEGDDPWPKGFVRVSGTSDSLHVVAFGQADSLRIERFGDSGYDFSPGLVSKLASDPWIAFWGSMLAAYIALVLGFLPLVESTTSNLGLIGARERFLRIFRKDTNR